jgi:hypothetical protein
VRRDETRHVGACQYANPIVLRSPTCALSDGRNCAAASVEREPPKANTFCSNDNANKVTFTAAEWEQVRSNSQKYAKLLGKG